MCIALIEKKTGMFSKKTSCLDVPHGIFTSENRQVGKERREGIKSVIRNSSVTYSRRESPTFACTCLRTQDFSQKTPHEQLKASNMVAMASTFYRSSETML